MKSKDALELNYCRLCKSKNLKLVLDLGKSPLPNAYLKKSQLKNEEPIFPLKVNFCPNCGQLQLSHVAPPEFMFRNYAYVSSTSPVMISHFNEYANSVFKKLKLEKESLVVELGSNDGVLLKQFKKLGSAVLGIDPAKNIANLATKEGIPTLPYFFSKKLARKVAKIYGKAKVITGNNVFAHIHDLDEVVEGVHELLDDRGAFVVEFPYLVDFLDNNVFDSVYHEHLSYLAVNPLNRFFKNFGMQIFDCYRTPVQGGSVRIFVKRKGGKYKITKNVAELLALEKIKGLDKIQTHVKFAKKVEKTKKSLNTLLKKLKKQNKKIVGYGAPGRSTTLLNFCGIDTKFLDYIVDDNPLKIGLYTPGTHIPIFDISKLWETNPDYIFISSWNFATPIIEKLKKQRNLKGKFIIPIPKPQIV